MGRPAHERSHSRYQDRCDAMDALTQSASLRLPMGGYPRGMCMSIRCCAICQLEQAVDLLNRSRLLPTPIPVAKWASDLGHATIGSGRAAMATAQPIAVVRR